MPGGSGTPAGFQGSAVGSTIVQVPANAPAGTKPTVSSAALVSLRQLSWDQALCTDPAKLANSLGLQQRNMAEAIRQVSSIPIGGGNLLRNIVVAAANTTLYLQHGLNRPYVGYFSTRAQGGVFSAEEAALPAIATSSQVLPLTFTNAGTFDLYIF